MIKYFLRKRNSLYSRSFKPHHYLEIRNLDITSSCQLLILKPDSYQQLIIKAKRVEQVVFLIKLIFLKYHFYFSKRLSFKITIITYRNLGSDLMFNYKSSEFNSPKNEHIQPTMM